MNPMEGSQPVEFRVENSTHGTSMRAMDCLLFVVFELASAPSQ